MGKVNDIGINMKKWQKLFKRCRRRNYGEC